MTPCLERLWVFDRRTMAVVEVEIAPMEQADDPMTRGLVRVGDLGMGFRHELPIDRAAAVAEARHWLTEQIKRHADALSRVESSAP